MMALPDWPSNLIVVHKPQTNRLASDFRRSTKKASFRVRQRTTINVNPRGSSITSERWGVVAFLPRLF